LNFLGTTAEGGKIPPVAGDAGALEWHIKETYKGLITISIEALKALALINGGAAVALRSTWRIEGKGQLARGGALPNTLRPQS
jgi:hypothetical protein